MIEAIAETERPRTYWTDLKRRLMSQGFTELHERIVQLKMRSEKDGKMTICSDCAANKGLVPKDKGCGMWVGTCPYCRRKVSLCDEIYDYKYPNLENLQRDIGNNYPQYTGDRSPQKVLPWDA